MSRPRASVRDALTWSSLEEAKYLQACSGGFPDEVTQFRWNWFCFITSKLDCLPLVTKVEVLYSGIKI